MIARRLVLSGRVQGVFFRETFRQTAQTRGVAGWVRNCPDGTVEAHVEGDEDAVESITRWAMQGPSRAEVEGIDASDAPVEGLSGFDVR